MVALVDYKETACSHVVIYGDPFTGKTTLAGKLAEKFNLKWFDLEHGISSAIRNVPKEFHKNIELFPIPDTKVNPIASETMLKVFAGGECKICLTHGKVACPICKATPDAVHTSFNLNTMTSEDILVVDSATQLSTSILSHIMRNRPNTAKPEWDDYAIQGRLLDVLYTQMQNCKANVLIISHATLVSTEDAKLKKLVPIGGTDNYSRTMAKFFDDVIYCEVGNKGHKFTSGTGGVLQAITGSKHGVSIETMAIPSLIPFFNVK